MVIIHDKISDSQLRKNLEYAWKLKFLDITVIVLENCQSIRPLVYYFNPFKNYFHNSIFNYDTQFFPDKLKNLYQYKLNLPLFNLKPFQTFELDKNGKILKIEKMNHNAFKIMNEKLNFSINYTVINGNTHSNIILMYNSITRHVIIVDLGKLSPM